MPSDFEIVLIDLHGQVADAADDLRRLGEETTQVAADLDDAERRLRALQDELGSAVPTSTAKPSLRTPRPPSKVPENGVDWGCLVSDARSRHADDQTLDELLDDETVDLIERRFSADFRVKTSLDRYDVVAMVAAGIVAGLVDFFLVRIPKTMEFPLGSQLQQKGSPLTGWLRQQAVPHDEAPFSSWAKVAYDRVNLTTTGQDIPGSGGKSHRFHTLGHDPVLGLVFGVLDILRGSTTGIDRGGNLVYIPGTAHANSNPFLALALQLAHVISDASTSMGVPAPGWTALGAAQFGAIGKDDLTVAQVSRLMYVKGYDLRHFLTQTTSVAAAELVLHAYWYLREALDERWAEDVDLEWSRVDLDQQLQERTRVRRLGPHPRYQAVALGTHAIGAAANAGKIALSGGNPLALNPLALNYAQWLRFLHASFRYSQRYFGSPSTNMITGAWLNERALAGGWPELDWTNEDAPTLG